MEQNQNNFDAQGGPIRFSGPSHQGSQHGDRTHAALTQDMRAFTLGSEASETGTNASFETQVGPSFQGSRGGSKLQASAPPFEPRGMPSMMSSAGPHPLGMPHAGPMTAEQRDQKLLQAGISITPISGYNAPQNAMTMMPNPYVHMMSAQGVLDPRGANPQLGQVHHGFQNMQSRPSENRYFRGGAMQPSMFMHPQMNHRFANQYDQGFVREERYDPHTGAPMSSQQIRRPHNGDVDGREPFQFPNPNSRVDGPFEGIQRFEGFRHRHDSSLATASGHARHATSTHIQESIVSPIRCGTEPTSPEPFPEYDPQYGIPLVQSPRHERHVSFDGRLVAARGHVVSKSDFHLPESTISPTPQKRRQTVNNLEYPGSPTPVSPGSTVDNNPSDSAYLQERETALVLANASSDQSGTMRKLMSTLNKDGYPTFEAARHHLPLCNQLESNPQRNRPYGVVKITNIPYNATRSDIIVLFGEKTALAPDAEGESIHIIMDRQNGKTMDAFIEFPKVANARHHVDRLYQKHSKKNGASMGRRCGMVLTRHVQMEVVTPGVLMRELFPRAKGVEWSGYEPKIKDSKPGKQLGGTFITSEELNLLLAQVTKHKRHNYSADAPQRPWETLISIMAKYPWHMTKHILLKDRDLLWQTCLDLIKPLKAAIAADTAYEEKHLTQDLLSRFCAAVRRCKGFTVAQKHEIHEVAGIQAHWPPHPEDWIWQALGPVKTIVDEHDVLKFYMDLINRLSFKPLSLEEQSRIREDYKNNTGTDIEGTTNLSVWGPIKIPYPSDYQNTTMAEIARVEFKAIENCFRQLLPFQLLPTPPAV